MNTPLKRARLGRFLTQSAVAEAVGIKQGYYSRIENGDATASPDIAEKLATFFLGTVSETEILYPARYVIAAEVA